MLEWLKELDRDLLLYLNSFHTPFLDPVMFWVTKTLVLATAVSFLIISNDQIF
jgi:undecaprenyl-diphosphatase